MHQHWRFIGAETDLGTAVSASYNLPLVVLSVLVASLAALAALAVVERLKVLRTRDSRQHRAWIAIGAFTMGSGIWAMHFTGMLAFSLPLTVSYSLNLTLISMIPAMLGSAAGLWVMSRMRVNWVRFQFGGLMMALGIGTMHYTGMEAMQMQGQMAYIPSLFILSIVVAHVLATASLYVRFALPHNNPAAKALSAVIMGCAVSGMHYTAMAAVRFFPGGPKVSPAAHLPPTVMAVLICIAVSLIIGLTLLGTRLDRVLMEATDATVENATRYGTLLDTLADGLLVLDQDGRVETFNASAARLFDCPVGEAVGRQMQEFVPSSVADTVDYLDHYERTGDAYLTSLGRGLTGRRADGSVFPLELVIAPMRIRGRMLHVCTVRDTTARHQMEEHLAQSTKLESIGQLAAGVAHEINTPTQYIGDNLRFLQESLTELAPALVLARKVSSSPDDPDRQACPEAMAKLRSALDAADLEFLLEEIPRATQEALEGITRVSSIVQAMKAFSHPATERVLLDLNHSIASTITVASNEWKYVANLEQDLQADLPEVPCMPGEINQVVLNLIVNAAHAINDVVKDSGDKGTIRVTTRAQGPWAEICISDTGKGMTPEIKSRIFDPFFTTKPVGKGTGQGLSIAHSIIVKKHHGSIDVDSTPGKGSSFTLRLPLAEVTEARVSGEMAAPDAPQPAHP